MTVNLDELQALIDRLRNFRHATVRRDGSTLGTMAEAADALEALRDELIALRRIAGEAKLAIEIGRPLDLRFGPLKAALQSYEQARGDSNER